MKKRIADFFRKLRDEETGASHIVEIIVVIIIVLALAAILLSRLKTSVGNSADKLDEFIEGSITVEAPYVI